MRRKTGAVLVVLAAACGGAADDPVVRDPTLRGYLPEGSSALDSAEIRGLNLWGYCESRGYPAVGYRLGYIEGPRAAHDNWVCQRGTEQLAPVDSMVVDMTDACRWEYRREDLVARATDPDHAWSWHCYPGGS